MAGSLERRCCSPQVGDANRGRTDVDFHVVETKVEPGQGQGKTQRWNEPDHASMVCANGEEMPKDLDSMSDDACFAEAMAQPPLIHHFNWMGKDVHFRSTTPPAVSLVVIMSLLRPRGLTYGSHTPNLRRARRPGTPTAFGEGLLDWVVTMSALYFVLFAAFSYAHRGDPVESSWADALLKAAKYVRCFNFLQMCCY